jgi:hypothetical protein
MGWVGLGIATSTQMTNSDVVVCSDLVVKRQYITDKAPLTSLVVVPGSSCSQVNGMTTMVFTRKLAAENANQISIIKGGNTPVIFAWGSQNTISYHSANKAAKTIVIGVAVST